MKKALLASVLCLTLLLLSGCYSYTDVSRMKDELTEEYDSKIADLEYAYYEASASLDDCYDAIGRIEDDLIKLQLYFDQDDSVSFSDGYDAIYSIREILGKYF